MATDWAAQQKHVDPYNFVKAEDFFRNLDQVASGGEQASTVSDYKFNPQDSNGKRCLVLEFDNGRALSLRFVRPRVWHLQCNHNLQNDLEINSKSTKHVVQPTIHDLIEVLDNYEKLEWDVELVQLGSLLMLQSLIKEPGGAWAKATQLCIQRQPFQITAVQPLKTIDHWTGLPYMSSSAEDPARFDEVPGVRASVVWQIKERGIRYQGTSTILSVEKPSTARYVGWGEQGGSSFTKDNTFLNYFNYDNMAYRSVYGNGPLDPREPLYHSEPFWIEANRHPGYQSKTATFVANYSQICIDLGKSDASTIRVATRFDPAEFYVFAEQDIARVIAQYTAIVGRSWLKPRYALGYGQGCYGYDTRLKVENSVRAYRRNKFPLDTMHIDVDLQEEYRTFTVDEDEGKFPNPASLFSDLKQKGVKCCTNITPFINGEKSETYKTLNEMICNGYYVPDERYLKATVVDFRDQRYISYESGKVVISDPNVDRPGFKDDYLFEHSFNQGKSVKKSPYHGGVNYGKELGRSGYYPDLNRVEVRKWWGEQYNKLIEYGLEFVWQDMTSPAISKEYGDMKSFPCRLLLPGQDDQQPKQPAIEVWSLYAYNLHKATFQGWNKSALRRGKRNFIIGRGSFSGMHRYAGLWTGDNTGTWDFLSISVAQALALGICGLVIAGGDVGGFMGKPGEKYTEPELLIRWYSSCFLLPWFRNHYNGKPGQKLFQEPFAYEKYHEKHAKAIGEDEASLFKAVLPVSRYFTRLRYSLMQMLYDAMFENLITGLPIVNSLATTEVLDESLYLENEQFLSSEFIVRKDLLVAPITTKAESSKGWRTVYLPGPDDWFKFNLSCNDVLEEKPTDEDFIGHALTAKVHGGSRVKVEARIQTDSPHLASITPMFIREGAIIPKMKPRDYIADRTMSAAPPDQITFHIYPGKNNSYDMYLDDGVSRDSAPTSCFKTKLSADKDEMALVADEEAKSCYRQVRVTHETLSAGTVRRVCITTTWDGYGKSNVNRDIGECYRVALWQERPDTVSANVQVKGTKTHDILQRDETLRVILLQVAVEADDEASGICIEQSC